VARGHEAELRIEVSPGSVAPGEDLELAVDELAPAQEVRVELLTASGPRVLAAGSTDSDGSVRLGAKVPADAAPRYYELHLMAGADVVAVGYLEVVPSAAQPQTDEAGTGGPAGWTGLAWGAAAALGVAVLAVPVLAALRPRRMTGAGRTRPPDA
jgi:hypothetical protein